MESYIRVLDDHFYDALNQVHTQIRGTKLLKKDIERIESAYKEIIDLSNLARTEGLLALEDRAMGMKDTPLYKYIFSLVMLVVDGTDYESVWEIGMNRFISKNYTGVDGLVYLICFRGVVSIQCGHNPRYIMELLASLLPEDLDKAIIDKIYTVDYDAELERRIQSLEKMLDEDEPFHVSEEDKSTVDGQLTIFFSNADDLTVQRVLRDTENSVLSVFLKGASPAITVRVFKNLSKKLGLMIMEDMEYMGPVRIIDVEQARDKIVNTIISLAENGEIIINNLTELKLFKEISDTIASQKDELRKKYKDVKSALDNLYSDY